MNNRKKPCQLVSLKLLRFKTQNLGVHWTAALCLFLLMGACSSDNYPVHEKQITQVCVYGATPGGVAAAIAAARSGSEVLLIEPTDHLGGMLSSGLSHADFHSMEALTGTFLEFSQRVKAYYADTYGPDSEQVLVSYEGTFGEPKVNLKILEEMIGEQERIKVMKQAVLQQASVTQHRIDSLILEQSGTPIHVQADVFIDGTYEGDLMAGAGVPYQVGREARDEYGETLAPEQADGQLQGYNFRFCATTDPENRAPVLEPAGYVRDSFLALLPILESGKIDQVFGYPKRCIYKAQIPPLPNGKYDINDVSNGLVRLSMPGRNLGWPEDSPAERKQIFDAHVRHNVGLLYFLQNDEAVPAKYQKEAQEWGWCRDEFIDNNHLPPQLYIREARRMQGQYIYTQKDSDYAPGDARTVRHPTSVAMGDYNNNCHGTDHEGPLIGGRHLGEFYNPMPPYQIPYGTLIPQQLENLVVPVAVSASHVGFCALRLEPIWMSLGQAAGQAAALAAQEAVKVQEVNIQALQSRLHAAGAATIYVSDVPPGHPDFAAVQWWGSQGGLHGLESRPSNGPRGANIQGQYYEAAPGHAVRLDEPLKGPIKDRWLELVKSWDVTATLSDSISTRGDLIRWAFHRD